MADQEDKDESAIAKPPAAPIEAMHMLPERARVNLPVRGQYEPLHLASHTDLARHQAEIIRRINAEPQLSVMLLVNPVLAFKELGINAEQGVSNHVLDTLQFSAASRKELSGLQASLAGEFGERPRPNDPVWLAQAVFAKLKLEPLEIRGLTPVYRPIADDATLERLRALRPARVARYALPPRPRQEARVGVGPDPPALRRLDLEAPAPKAPAAPAAPARLSLQELYFYKDRHPQARALLQLGLLELQGLGFQTPATFRSIRDGSQANAFRAWITAVSFPDRKR